MVHGKHHLAFADALRFTFRVWISRPHTTHVHPRLATFETALRWPSLFPCCEYNDETVMFFCRKLRLVSDSAIRCFSTTNIGLVENNARPTEGHATGGQGSASHSTEELRVIRSVARSAHAAEVSMQGNLQFAMHHALHGAEAGGSPNHPALLPPPHTRVSMKRIRMGGAEPRLPPFHSLEGQMLAGDLKVSPSILPPFPPR